MSLFLIITFLLLFGLGLVFASVDRQDVIANWDKKRCDIPVILGAPFYQPPTSTTTSLEFAGENFQFCMNKITKEVFTAAVNPLLTLFKQQLDAANVVKDVQTSIQEMLGNFFRGFSKLLDGVFQRFMGVGFELRRIFGEINQAMQRAFGVAISTVFLGISTVVGIDNTVKAVIKIVLIIMGILAGLMILLFLILLPFFPVIMTTIGVLVASGIGGAAAGFASTFCFAPGTKVNTQDGPKQIQHIQLGDILQENKAVVEGVLKVNGSDVQMYSIDDILVSGDHMVLYEPLKRWILVKEHPDAKLVLKKEPILYCLNTSTRTIPIGKYIFRDWEELTPEIQTDWNKLVGSVLGSTLYTETEDYPVLSGAWNVKTPDGLVAIRDILLGMKVLDENNKFTKVLGLYQGRETPNGTAPFWSTDAIWWKQQNTWVQKPIDTTVTKPPYKKHGFHLITDSGTFIIFDATSSYPVRDFTEVGHMRIAETYEWMKARL